VNVSLKYRNILLYRNMLNFLFFFIFFRSDLNLFSEFYVICDNCVGIID